MHWRCGACEVVNLIHFDEEGGSDIVPDDLEIGVAHEMENVAFVAGEVIVKADDFIAVVKQTFAQM